MKSLVPWRQHNTGFLSPFGKDMEDFFQKFFAPMVDDEATAFHGWAPRVDVEEGEKELMIKADLPGVDPKDIDISVSNGRLILRGEKKEEKEDKKKNYRRMERFVGQFYREIPLPEGTDTNKISATNSKGVIQITIPKNPEVQPRKIAVKAQD